MKSCSFWGLVCPVWSITIQEQSPSMRALFTPYSLERKQALHAQGSVMSQGILQHCWTHWDTLQAVTAMDMSQWTLFWFPCRKKQCEADENKSPVLLLHGNIVAWVCHWYSKNLVPYPCQDLTSHLKPFYLGQFPSMPPTHTVLKYNESYIHLLQTGCWEQHWWQSSCTLLHRKKRLPWGCCGFPSSSRSTYLKPHLFLKPFKENFKAWLL